jgi:hypothetical protein
LKVGALARFPDSSITASVSIRDCHEIVSSANCGEADWQRPEEGALYVDRRERQREKYKRPADQSAMEEKSTLEHSIEQTALAWHFAT